MGSAPHRACPGGSLTGNRNASAHPALSWPPHSLRLCRCLPPRATRCRIAATVLPPRNCAHTMAEAGNGPCIRPPDTGRRPSQRCIRRDRLPTSLPGPPGRRKLMKAVAADGSSPHGDRPGGAGGTYSSFCVPFPVERCSVFTHLFERLQPGRALPDQVKHFTSMFSISATLYSSPSMSA